MRLLSPVFFKELGQMAVSRKPVVMKAVLMAVLMADFIMMMWSTYRTYELSSGEFGRNLFMTLAFVELGAMVVFTPIVTAGMVCGEREANTLGLLFLTKLKAWNIVQDKGLSRIIFMLTLWAVTLPFMFAALLFGGVETSQIVAAAGNILALILTAGGISLLCSTLVRRYGAALALSYSILFIFLVVVPIFVAIVLEEIMRWRGASLRLVCSVNPFLSTGMSLSPHELRTAPYLLYTWMTNLALGALLYLLAVSIAARLLRRLAFAEVAAESRPTLGWAKAMWRKPLPFHPARLFHRKDVMDGNPVTWKETNLLDDSLKTVLIRIADMFFGIYLILLFLLFMHKDLDEEAIHLVGHAFAFCATAVFTAIVAACSFAREREGGTFEVLLSTRLTGRTLVMGTFWGVVRSVMPFIVLLVGVLLIGVAATASDGTLCVTGVALLGVAGVVLTVGRLARWDERWQGWRAFVVPVGVAALFCFAMAGALSSKPNYRSGIMLGLPMINVAVYLGFVVVLGMFMSLVCKTTAKAIGWTLTVMLAVTVGIPIMALFIEEGLDLHGAGEFILALSPDYWVATGPSGHERFDRDFGGVAGYIAVTAAYAAAAGGLLAGMIHSFDRIVGRQSSGWDRP